MRQGLARFWSLGRSEKRTFVVAATLAPLFWLGLRVFGLVRFRQWLLRASPSRAQDLRLDEMKALARIVNAAALRTIGPANCLTRSLLLDWLLHRQGVESQLRIGVRLDRGILAAHAWVEFEGVPVNDSPDIGAEFQPFANALPLKSFRT